MRRTGAAITAVGLVFLLGAATACGSSKDSTSTGSSSATTAPGGTTGTTGTSGGTPASKASSDELKKWQTDLNAVGCSAGPVDGVEGGETEAAIKAFQAYSGLTVDGLLGPQTEAALTKAVAAGTKVCIPTAPSSTTSTTAASGASTTTTAASGASTTTTAKASTTTTQAGTSCPPKCAPNLAINPGYGPAGTVVNLGSAGTECDGPVTFNPKGQAPSPAGTLAPVGAGQSGLAFEIPPSMSPGTYVFTATACGAVAYFQLT